VTHEEIKVAITEGVKEAFQNPELHCRYRIASEQHDDDHRVMQQFIKNLGKISDIKFFVIRWAVVAILTLLMGWAGIGIVHSIKGG
jgi:hypothetical protein